MGCGVRKRIENLSKNQKAAFVWALLIGLAVHIYKFVNTLPNHDSLYNAYSDQSDQSVLGSGRWLLSVACGFSSYFDLPWVIGILSLLVLAVAAVIIVTIFEIEDPVLVVLTSGLIVSFPSITETFFFEFSADGYFVAMLLAVIAVRLVPIQNAKAWQVALSALLICCVCGIYQSYVSFALILALCYLVWYLLKKDCTVREVLRWIGKQAIVYISGLAAYYLIWKICLAVTNVPVNNYQGIGELGLQLSTLLQAVPNTIRYLFFFFFEWNVAENGWTLYGALNVLFLAALLFVLVTAVVKSRLYKAPSKLVILIVALLAIPFAACMWCFASSTVSYRPMMLGGLVCLYILVGVLAQSSIRLPKLCNAVGILLAVIIFNNGLAANISYYYMNECYESSYAIGAEMMSRIHMLDADTQACAVVVVGDRSAEVSLNKTTDSKGFHMLAQLLESDLLYNDEHTIRFLQNTFDENIHGATKAVTEEITARTEVQEMGAWPASDSVALIDDVIVIKLAEAEESTQ